MIETTLYTKINKSNQGHICKMVSYKTSRETEQENSCEFEARQKVLRPDKKIIHEKKRQ